MFELTPEANGTWTEKILHSFGIGLDGFSPTAGLIFDAHGNLYGTTADGGHAQISGTFKGGTVFELTKMCGGWTEKILHNFASGNDGYNPEAGLIFDAAGNLYGTTSGGGMGPTQANGTVFELSPSAERDWAEKVLYNFGVPSGTGFTPAAGLILDASGNLFGTTTAGGTAGTGTDCYSYECGTVFELTPAAGGVWNESTLHNFQGTPTDGGSPFAGLISDGSGNLYGTTSRGGKDSKGTVFEITP